eukprot:6704076-Pyramimonas_sp.AAC.1
MSVLSPSSEGIRNHPGPRDCLRRRGRMPVEPLTSTRLPLTSTRLPSTSTRRRGRRTRRSGGF